MTEDQFECEECGGNLKFVAGTKLLECPYCGASNEIVPSELSYFDAYEEHSYTEILAQQKENEETVEQETVKCSGCSAQIDFDPQVKSKSCPYCGNSIISEKNDQKFIRAQALLPFKIKEEEATKHFKRWLRKLWFAPSDLKKKQREENKISGMYLPYWTYDSSTRTPYRGQRGEHYWDKEYYTDANGKEQSRSVRKTRWHSASGTVYNTFDDILVIASKSLPRKYLRKLEPWDLPNAEPFDEKYLSGFRTERYTIPLEDGFQRAQEIMEPKIRKSIERDIGGDDQRITNFETYYKDITFKHLLLPVWVNAYRFKDKSYRFIVNARTGEVQGERPWSIPKIATAVILGLGVVAGIIYYVGR